MTKKNERETSERLLSAAIVAAVASLSKLTSTSFDDASRANFHFPFV